MTILLFQQFISPPPHLPLSRRLSWRDSSNSYMQTLVCNVVGNLAAHHHYHD